MHVRAWAFTVILCFAIALSATGIEPVVLEELPLVHWEQVPGGRPSYTGPVSAAVLLAWYAQRGYPELLPDLSRNGRIDEQDTVLLAQELARAMGADVFAERLPDPFVIYSLAGYVAERYPNTFRVLVYDTSFPEEWRRDLGRPFVPTEIPGIVFEVLEDPQYESYAGHLDAGRPGIVGVGFDGSDWNHFAVGRSYRPEETPEGRPVDLVNTGFEPFGPSPVWETFMRFQSERWGLLMPNWVPFEILVVLLPEGETGAASRQPDDLPGSEPGGDQAEPPGSVPGDDGKLLDGGDTRIPSDSDETGPCCLPDGSCRPVTASECIRLGGAFTVGATCGTVQCPRSPSGPCAAVSGEIVTMCYDVETDGSYTLRVTYTLTNSGPVNANNISALFLASLSDGGGSAVCGSVWMHGITVHANGGTYTHTQTFNGFVSFFGVLEMYGGLWIQTLPPWTCFPIVDQDAVRTERPAVRCSAGTTPGSQPQPSPTQLPNLWVTDMEGCWTWSVDGQEHVVATVSGIVHNGGQAAASNVRAKIAVGGKSVTVTVGSIAAGGQSSVSATVDIGEYHTVSWPVPTSITADPLDQIAEADESNNTTDSSFPQSSDCD